jgi:hypothetical protein
MSNSCLGQFGPRPGRALAGPGRAGSRVGESLPDGETMPATACGYDVSWELVYGDSAHHERE